MLCPICATEMNGSMKCPFCGHVCEPGEDNRVLLNGQVIRDGHHHDWCETTDDKHLAGQIVDGTHYHAPNPYQQGGVAPQARQSQTIQPPPISPQAYHPQQPGQPLTPEQRAQKEAEAKRFTKIFLIIAFIVMGIPIILAFLTPFIMLLSN